MSEPGETEGAHPSMVAYATFRVYRKKDGRYKAFASVERTDTDLKTKPVPITEGGSQETPEAALGEVLQLSGFVK